MKLAIYGAGGLGREVLELAMQINKLQSRWSSLCFIDDINANRQLKSHDVLSILAVIQQSVWVRSYVMALSFLAIQLSETMSIYSPMRVLATIVVSVIIA